MVENNCIPTILESVGCRDNKEFRAEWRAALPNKENKSAVCVKKEALSSAIRTSDGRIKGDIFTVVMDIKNV